MYDIHLFTSQPKARFYNDLFTHLDTSIIEASKAVTGNPGYPKEALFCAFIVMKCEGFSQVSDLCDYLDNNRLIAYYCGFDITKDLPSYWTYARFLKNLDNRLLKKVMEQQVLHLAELGIVDTSFIGLDSTPVAANTANNNPKSFRKDKFCKDKPPKSDKHCGLGIHTASNQHSEKNYEFYWGYKNHVLCDVITGLPLLEMTTPANISDCEVALDMLRKTNTFLSIRECYFIADAAYDSKNIYNTIRDEFYGECFIPINPRNTKNPKKLPVGNLLCDAGLAMVKDGKCRSEGRYRQKFCCPYKSSKTNSCPCNHKNWNNGKKHRGCFKYLTIPDDYRLAIDRGCTRFKSIYSLRTESERYNSRFKSTGQERLWVRNGKSAENLNTLAHISLLAIAVAAVVTKAKISYRSLKSVKRIA
ncbi:MAG: transposase [Oscillospiraceae bacterium]|nr:transposase [Oscillospiraceae bacterium]